MNLSRVVLNATPITYRSDGDTAFSQRRKLLRSTQRDTRISPSSGPFVDCGTGNAKFAPHKALDDLYTRRRQPVTRDGLRPLQTSF